MPGRLSHLIAAGLVLLAVVLPARPGAAQEDAVRRLGLVASVGFDGGRSGTSWVPVAVTVAPERLFAGRIEVTGRGGTGELVHERDVEVAGGGRKVFRFLLPAARDVLVRAVPDGGGEPASVRPEVRRLGTRDLLVGVLGGVPQDAPLVETRPTGLTVTYAGVDPEWIELSPRALHSLGTLVAPAAALADLDEPSRRNLANAVEEGLELVVTPDAVGATTDLGAPGLPDLPATAVTDGALAADPDAWTMTTAEVGGGAGASPSGTAPVLVAASNLGRGRVTVVATPLGGEGVGRDAGLWAQVLAPGAQRQYDHSHEPAVSRVMESAQQALSGNSLGLPSLPWLAAFLLAYVLVVGPLNGILLARAGRRELAWLTVPAITVLFAGGAFVAAAASAPPTGLSGRVAYWIDGAGTDLAVGAVRAPTPGQHTIAFDGGGWDVSANSFRQPARVRHDRADTEVGFDLESLEVGLAVGWRPTSAPAPLEIDAVARGDELEVTVRNVGSVGFEDVHVRAATARASTGRLEPGASASTTLGVAELRTADPWAEQELLIEHPGPGGGPEMPESLEHLLRFQALDAAPGLVWAVGVAPDGLGQQVTHIDGRRGDDVGALVAVAEAPRIDGDVVSPYAVHRALAQVTGQGAGEPGWWPGPAAVEGVDSVVLRYRLPHVQGLRTVTGTLDASSVGMDHPVVEMPGRFPECPPGETCEEHHTECDERGCTEVTRRVTCDDSGCRVEEERCGPDGSCSGSVTEGLEVEVVEPGEPPSPVAPPEPPRPDLRGPPPPGGPHVEIWQVADGAWVALEDVFAGGQADPALVVNGLGEVHVRIRAGGMLAEFSGRGIGAVGDGGAT